MRKRRNKEISLFRIVFRRVGRGYTNVYDGLVFKDTFLWMEEEEGGLVLFLPGNVYDAF